MITPSSRSPFRRRRLRDSKNFACVFLHSLLSPVVFALLLLFLIHIANPLPLVCYHSIHIVYAPGFNPPSFLLSLSIRCASITARLTTLMSFMYILYIPSFMTPSLYSSRVRSQPKTMIISRILERRWCCGRSSQPHLLSFNGSRTTSSIRYHLNVT